MRPLHSLDDEPLRTARYFILRNEEVPVTVEAVLEARGISVSDLRERLLSIHRWR